VTKAKISEYSATAGDNTDVNGTNIAEGCPPSGINDAIREVMAALKRFETGADGDSVTVGGNLVVSGSTTANTLSTTVLQSDTISEKTSAAGVTIDGVLLKDNGVVTGAGTVSAPVYSTTGDTNTGIFFPAADTIAFAEGGAEAMRITSDGNVGIGTSSPNTTLEIKAPIKPIIRLNGNGNNAASTNYGAIEFWNSDTSGPGQNIAASIKVLSNSNLGTGAGGQLVFSTSVGSEPEQTEATEAMRIEPSGNVGVGTSSPEYKLKVNSASATNGLVAAFENSGSTGAGIGFIQAGVDQFDIRMPAGSNSLAFYASGTAERMRITNAGEVLVGRTDSAAGNKGAKITQTGFIEAVVEGAECFSANRKNNDGTLMLLQQQNVTEGTISVSGTTVSYNGGHLSRWAQTTTAKDESLKKGTVLSNLDEMNVYTDSDGNPVENEQLNKVKVSDVEGDANVAGVFVNWDYDEAHQVDEINMAMTGDMIIRIAQGVTVARGDLLMSAGDGTAKPQGDDIVRSKTIAKVTSTHVTCTYEDGSYCVPCVLMAC
jgi:hypothetical protein